VPNSGIGSFPDGRASNWGYMGLRYQSVKVAPLLFGGFNIGGLTGKGGKVKV